MFRDGINSCKVLTANLSTLPTARTGLDQAVAIFRLAIEMQSYGSYHVAVSILLFFFSLSFQVLSSDLRRSDGLLLH